MRYQGDIKVDPDMPVQALYHKVLFAVSKQNDRFLDALDRGEAQELRIFISRSDPDYLIHYKVTDMSEDIDYGVSS